MAEHSVSTLDTVDAEANKLAGEREVATDAAPTKREPTTTVGKAWAKMSDGVGLEAHGVRPLTEEERQDANFFASFTLW
jgi:hypothetical protein